MCIALAAALTARFLKHKELDDAKEANEKMATQVTWYDMTVAENEFISAQYRSIVGLDENIYTYPVCNTDVRNLIRTCAGNYAEVSFESAKLSYEMGNTDDAYHKARTAIELDGSGSLVKEAEELLKTIKE